MKTLLIATVTFFVSVSNACIVQALNYILETAENPIPNFPTGLRKAIEQETKFYVEEEKKFWSAERDPDDKVIVALPNIEEFHDISESDPEVIDVSIARTYRKPHAPIFLSSAALSILNRYTGGLPHRPDGVCIVAPGARLLLEEILDHIVPLSVSEGLNIQHRGSEGSRSILMADLLNKTIADVFFGANFFTERGWYKHVPYSQGLTLEGYLRAWELLPPELR